MKTNNLSLMHIPTIRVPLTKGMFAIVNESDAHLVLPYKWRSECIGKTFYATRSHYIDGRYRKIYMHRLIAGFPKGMDIDHEFGNGLDNRRHKLRVCTRSQNMANVPKKQSKSRFKGVYWFASKRKWTAVIKVNYKRRTLGYFRSEAAAAKAYDDAAISAWGKFAKTNFA